MNVQKNGLLCGRRIEFFHHSSKAEWGYTKEQQDTFAVHYPKDYKETETYPLYVVFHSAGHDVYSAVACVWAEGNHDIYHTPDGMFGLFLDCRANMNDWWWGGINAYGVGDPARGGIVKQPVENRCIATVEWMLDNYNIDRDRVYAVGNSMGGSGALGVTLCRGDIFAAVKVNVPAGVRHAADRCCLDTEYPDGFSIPDPPIVVDYSAQNDEWSAGHEILYRGMREHRYALHGYWGEFGHENNHSVIAQYNDLVHAVPVFEMKKSQAYPVFTNADTDDLNPWENPEGCAAAGQVNGFFRWETLKDTADSFEMKLWLLRPSEWETRIPLPETACADLLLRRVQEFKLSQGEKFSWKLTSADGEELKGVSCAESGGYPSIRKLIIKRDAQILTLTREE